MRAKERAISKKGRISKKEQEQILGLAHQDETVESIARMVNRTPEAVEKILDKHLPEHKRSELARVEDAQAYINNAIENDWERTEEFKQIKAQLTTEELRFFKERYQRTLQQFEGEVTAMENSQICQLIRHEILMNRDMMERRRAREDLEEAIHKKETFLAALSPNPMQWEQEEKSYLEELAKDIARLEKAESGRSASYFEAQKHHENLSKLLKATRDQRLERIENDTKNFMDIIKKFDSKQAREIEGRRMELERLAGLNAYKELSAAHEYEDGSVDIPILNADTI